MKGAVTVCFCIVARELILRINLGKIPSPSKLEDVDDPVLANTCLVSYLIRRNPYRAITWLLVSLDLVAPRPDAYRKLMHCLTAGGEVKVEINEATTDEVRILSDP